jgi:hypothetical protein
MRTMRACPARRCRAFGLLVPALLALTACGGDDQSAAQQVASGSGQDGSLVSIAQAQQGAEQWFNDHDQALLKRDATSLARLDVEPLALVEVETVRAALGTNRGVIAAARQPTAVRVHVPAAQSWPVPVLAVYDLPPAGGGAAAEHLAVLLARLNPGAAFVAALSAGLDAPEPQFDTDAAGYVRTGSQAGPLGAALAQYMQGTVHGTATPTTPPFAGGKLTSEAAAADAALLHDAPGHSRGTLNTVDIDYAQIAAPAPVFDVAGGGGFTLVATRRIEALHPTAGQALLQDPQRRNYGVDLPPGQYPQITIQAALVLAARIPAAGGPAEVAGSGGGVYQEG